MGIVASLLSEIGFDYSQNVALNMVKVSEFGPHPKNVGEVGRVSPPDYEISPNVQFVNQ